MNAVTQPSSKCTLDELIREILDLVPNRQPYFLKDERFLTFEVFDASCDRIFIHERSNSPSLLEPDEGICHIKKDVSGGLILADGTVRVSGHYSGCRLIYAEWRSGWHITVLTVGVHSPYQVRSIDDWAERVGSVGNSNVIAAAYKSRPHTGATTLTAFEFLERIHNQLVKDSRPQGLHDPIIYFI